MSELEVVMCRVEKKSLTLKHDATSIVGPQPLKYLSSVFQRVEIKIEPTPRKVKNSWNIAQNGKPMGFYPAIEWSGTLTVIRKPPN
jgi:hypothetical protein